MKSNCWLVLGVAVLAGCSPEAGKLPAQVVAPVPVISAVQAAVPVPVAKQEAASSVTQAAPASKRKEAPAAALPVSPVEVATVPVAPAPVPAAPVAEPVPAAEPAPVSETEAMALAKKRNCFACHLVSAKVVGPAWKDVAARYRGDAGAQVRLENKISKGGSGAWGSMAMPAQPQLSAEERTLLISFILGLK